MMLLLKIWMQMVMDLEDLFFLLAETFDNSLALTWFENDSGNWKLHDIVPWDDLFYHKASYWI